MSEEIKRPEIRTSGGIHVACCGQIVDWTLKAFASEWIPTMRKVEKVGDDPVGVDIKTDSVCYAVCPNCATLWVHASKVASWNKWMAMEPSLRAGRAKMIADGRALLEEARK